MVRHKLGESMMIADGAEFPACDYSIATFVDRTAQGIQHLITEVLKVLLHCLSKCFRTYDKKSSEMFCPKLVPRHVLNNILQRSAYHVSNLIRQARYRHNLQFVSLLSCTSTVLLAEVTEHVGFMSETQMSV